MDDMDVRAALDCETPSVATVWETRFAICQRLRLCGADLRRLIRAGTIETRLVNGERAFRERRAGAPRARPVALPPVARVEVLEKAKAPPEAPPPSPPNWAIELFVDRMAASHRHVGALTAERDALAEQVRALQALVDVQEGALGNAQEIIALLRARAARPHGAAVIRRFGRAADW